jgi:8-oxo-dGTP diphosphatase
VHPTQIDTDAVHRDSASIATMLDLLWRVGLRIAIRLLRVVWFFQRPLANGAYVAVWWDGNLLLIRNSYRDGEAVPCGAIDRGETPVQAAARELVEEAGIVAATEDLRFVCEIVVNFDFKEDHAHFFELHLETPPTVRIDNREVIWAQFVPEPELQGRPLLPHVRGYLKARQAAD